MTLLTYALVRGGNNMELKTVFGAIIFLVSVWFEVEGAQLSYDFYKRKCPEVEDIVRAGLQSITFTDPTTPAAVLRLLFHDCQVQGCDASILLGSSNSTAVPSEMASTKNFGIRNRESISIIKSMVEAVCPRQVSCADILVLAARDAIEISGGPRIRVPLGRRDSPFPFSYKLADAELPPADLGVDGMLRIFTAKGMTVEESVAIIGGHTLGVTHCFNVLSRLKNPKGDKKAMNLEPGFEVLLRLSCPFGSLAPKLGFVPNDLTTVTFDNHYYINAMMGDGVLRIDAELPLDPRTAPFVQGFASNQGDFFRAFSSAFVKLSSSGVLTGNLGVIRERCNTI